ncbi:MAG: hypothetical protein ACI9YL_001875, partial [Luteibaculaceae bacterium]
MKTFLLSIALLLGCFALSAQNPLIVAVSAQENGSTIPGQVLTLEHIDSNNDTIMLNLVTDQGAGYAIDTIYPIDFYGEITLTWENNCVGETSERKFSFSPQKNYYPTTFKCSTECPSSFNVKANERYVSEEQEVSPLTNSVWPSNLAMQYSIDGGSFSTLPPDRKFNFSTPDTHQVCVIFETPYCVDTVCRTTVVWPDSERFDYDLDVLSAGYTDVDSGRWAISNGPANVTYSWRKVKNGITSNAGSGELVNYGPLPGGNWELTATGTDTLTQAQISKMASFTILGSYLEMDTSYFNIPTMQGDAFIAEIDKYFSWNVDNHVWTYDGIPFSNKEGVDFPQLEAGDHTFCAYVSDESGALKDSICKTQNIAENSTCTKNFAYSLENGMVKFEFEGLDHEYGRIIIDTITIHPLRFSTFYYPLPANGGLDFCMGYYDPQTYCFDEACYFNVSGIEETASLPLDWTIYPNPSSDMVRVKAGTDVSLILMAMDGKTLWMSNQPGKQFDVDLSDYPSGMYILRTIGGHAKV